MPRNPVLWAGLGATVAQIALWYYAPLAGDVVAGKLFLFALPCAGRICRVPLWVQTLWAWLKGPKEPGFLPEKIEPSIGCTDFPTCPSSCWCRHRE